MPSPPAPAAEAAGSAAPVARPGPLPPWLWVWAIAFLLIVPTILHNAWATAWAFWRVSWLPLDLQLPIAVIHGFVAAFEMLPSLVFLAGIALAFLPGQRARRVERRFGLRPVEGRGGALAEIGDFIRTHAPELELRANLGRMAPSAFVYPLALRRSAVAVFGALVKTWRSDRAAAEAVLLHEIAHHRQGDPLIIGTGSFLSPVLRFWPLGVLVFALVVLALDLAFAAEIERFAGIYADVAPPELGPVPQDSWAVVFFYLHDFVWFLHPSLWVTTLQFALWLLAIALLPILATWCAELTADRYTAATPEGRAALRRALAAPTGRTPGWRPLQAVGRALRALSHPPLWLRRALIGHDRLGLALMVLLFPLAYLLSAVIVLVMAYVAALARGTARQGPLDFVLHGIPFLLAGIWVQLATIGALLLLWPLLRPVWLRLIAGIRQRPSLEGASILAPAGALLLAAVVALDPLRPPPTLAEQFAAMIEPERPPLPEEGPAIRATKPVFVTGEPIVLWLRDLPGPLQNWVSVVAPGTPPDIYVDVPGHWAYTDGLVTGEISMAPQLPGAYEARLYLDWPDGGTEIRGYDRFYVVSR